MVSLALLLSCLADSRMTDTAKPPPLRPELTGSVEELPPASQLSAKQPDPNTNTPEDKVTKRSAKDLSKDGKMPKWLNKAIGKK